MMDMFRQLQASRMFNNYCDEYNQHTDYSYHKPLLVGLVVYFDD